MSARRTAADKTPEQISTRLSRRSFLKLGIGAGTFSLGSMQAARGQPFGAIEWLDDNYLVDDLSREAVATDYGGAVRRTPRAVVRARTIEDVARTVA